MNVFSWPTTKRLLCGSKVELLPCGVYLCAHAHIFSETEMRCSDGQRASSLSSVSIGTFGGLPWISGQKHVLQHHSDDDLSPPWAQEDVCVILEEMSLMCFWHENKMDIMPEAMTTAGTEVYRTQLYIVCFLWYTHPFPVHLFLHPQFLALFSFFPVSDSL